MKIYCTPVSHCIFSQEESSTLVHIDTLLRIDDPHVQSSTHGQTECFGSEQSNEFKIHWVSVRLNQPGRLTGAVVQDLKSRQRYFFALEVTPTHDHRKTLAGNRQRLKSWRSCIENHLNSPLSALPEEESAIVSRQNILQYDGAFRRPDVQQMHLIEIPLEQGVICFGAPGTGKTLTAFQRAQASIKTYKTLLISPTSRAAVKMEEEFITQGIPIRTKKELQAQTHAEGSTCLSFVDFLLLMQQHYPLLKPYYKKKAEEPAEVGQAEEDKQTDDSDPRQWVDLNFFKSFYEPLEKTLKKKQRVTGAAHEAIAIDIKAETLWQEFCYVFMQPDWSEPLTKPCLLRKKYIGLGNHQSFIADAKQRAFYYDKVLMPFLDKIGDTTQFYCPIYIASQLYLTLIDKPLPLEAKFDALIVDEIQKFHPWQWACLLTILKEPLGMGRFFLCGDAHQSAECSPLRIVEPLRLFFEKEKILLPPIIHLLTNHRNSWLVSRFVAQVHALELSVSGSMERDTHVDTQIKEQNDNKGNLLLTNYNEQLREQVANNDESYVLIPDESCREFAKTYWSEQQIVTVAEFAGMAAKIVYLFGFSTRFKKTLNDIEQQFEEAPLPSWQVSQAFARRRHHEPSDLSNLRTCLQSIYTAASRATDSLIMVETHTFFKRLHEETTQQLSQDPGENASASAGAGLKIPQTTASSATILGIGKKSSREDWFTRAQTNFAQGLKKQAKMILLNGALWGRDKVAAVQKIITHQPEAQWFTLIHPILFPKAPMAAQSAMTVIAPVLLQNAQKSYQLTSKANDFLEKFLATFQANYIPKLWQVPKHSLAQVLFGHMKDGQCFLTKMVLKQHAPMFIDYIISKSKRQEVQKAYEEYSQHHTPSSLLALCWELMFLELENYDKKSKAAAPLGLIQCVKRIMCIPQNQSEFEALLDIPDGIAFLNQHKILIKNAIAEFFPLGINPLAWLIMQPKKLQANWELLIQTEIISAKMMHEIVITTETGEEMTAPFLLAGIEEGRQLIINKWDDFIKLGLLSAEIMHRAISSEGPLRDITVLLLLVSNTETQQLIVDKWDDFVKLGLLSAESMHWVIKAEGPFQGTTPFYWLTTSPVGRQLIVNKWDYFIEYGLISAESMHQVANIEGVHKGKTPFYWLLLKSPTLINIHWDYFVENNLFTEEALNMVIEDEYWLKGKTLRDALQIIAYGRPFSRKPPPLDTSASTLGFNIIQALDDQGIFAHKSHEPETERTSSFSCLLL